MRDIRQSVHVNLLSGTPVDRLGHRRRETEWLAEVIESTGARFVPTLGSRNLVRMTDPPRPALLSRQDLLRLSASLEDAVLLGSRDDRHYFAVQLEDEEVCSEDLEFRDLRWLGPLMEPWEVSLLAYARAMSLWHRNHRFCARCGSATVSADAGHARVCADSECGRRHFPKVDPAIIVLVSRGDRCLLGRQNSWPEGRFSTIAGFVEPGESLEDAVCREVYEETGVRVSKARYHSSQPWPFPSSLMLGFLARAETEEIALVDGELAEARWVTREDIRRGEVRVPPSISIAYALIRHWFDAEPGQDLAGLDASGPPVWR